MKALGRDSVASIVRIGLNVVWGVLWFLAICLGLAAVCYGAFLILSATGAIGSDVLTGDNHLRINGENVGFGDIAGYTWPVLVPAFLIGAVAIGGSLMIVWRLRRLFDSFSSGEPFRKENANHLRAIWMTMLGIEISRYVLLGLTGVLMAATHSTFAESADFEVRVDFSTWGSILILIVLAEVFREGARLKEEQELTI
ncbi:MAG: DUF2975 domain-containing protein [Caulobacteraceae bacterium]|nr:DUF2975 domain-containing protein [Caulobacteraceae bacterium]